MRQSNQRLAARMLYERHSSNHVQIITDKFNNRVGTTTL